MKSTGKPTIFGTGAIPVAPSIPHVCGQIASVIVEAGSEWLAQAATAVCEIFLDAPSNCLTFRERSAIVAARLSPRLGPDNELLMEDQRRGLAE